jgi:hypothetical protein
VAGRPARRRHSYQPQGGRPMKCPKCEYLGFETAIGARTAATIFHCLSRGAAGTGDCRSASRNRSTATQTAGCISSRLASMSCGRQANSTSAASDALGAMSLAGPPRRADRGRASGAAPTRPLSAQPPVRHVSPRGTPALPLFHPGGADSDEPLIKVAAPRRPVGRAPHA